MPLEDYKEDMERCIRCSHCKHVPYVPLARVDRTFRDVCPSVARFNWHSFSGGGKMITAYALLLNRIDYTPTLEKIVYACQMCGACDVSCKVQMDIEPFETLLELRARLVENGVFPAELTPIFDGLKKEDNMMQKPKAERGRWADGLQLKDLTKEKAEVAFHVGCRFSFDSELWQVARTAATLLKNAGVDVGIFGRDETCCGGRAYELGFQGEFIKYMDHNLEAWKNAGVKTVITPCSDCYATFKAWYSRYGHREFQVLHVVEYLEQLIKEGKIKLRRNIPMVVTYHDPCHLGRLSEPYLYSSPGKPYITQKKRVLGTMLIHEPPKPWRRGANGIYDPPRNILKSIPGLKFVEMYRIREYAWCCGAGGGVKDAYPDFAIWAAKQRIKEARAVGAEAIVTACGWCERNFKDALGEMDGSIKMYDLVELVEEAIE